MMEINMDAMVARKRSSWVNPEFEDDFLEMTMDG